MRRFVLGLTLALALLAAGLLGGCVAQSTLRAAASTAGHVGQTAITWCPLSGGGGGKGNKQCPTPVPYASQQ